MSDNNSATWAIFLPLAYVFACAVTTIEFNDQASTASKGMDQRADELLHEKCQQALENKGNLVTAHKEHQQKLEYTEKVNFEIFDGPDSGFRWKVFWGEGSNSHLAIKIDPDGMKPYEAQLLFADHYKITVSLNDEITSPRLTLKNDGSRSLLELSPDIPVKANAAAAAELMTEALKILQFLQEDKLSDNHAMGTYSFAKDGTVIFTAQEDPKTAQIFQLPARPAPAI